MREATVTGSAEGAYMQASPRSRALHEQACRVLPNGTTRSITYFAPYPLYMQRADGCRLWDVDGTERLDFNGNFTVLILGHRHPRVLEAMRQQLNEGDSFASPTKLEVELAQELCDRVPSVDAVRFVNSGTEATMFAMRLARACTGKNKIARMEGGYHGGHDLAEVSIRPPLDRAGPPNEPLAIPHGIGILDAAAEHTVVLPFNNAVSAERILTEHAHELAAVIVEPVLGSSGLIPPEGDFLQRLRAITERLKILLIFDEVITLRVAPGGAQELYGVKPDITVMGKIIGGGFPIGAYGGRADVMEVLDVRRPQFMTQMGTHSGNPIVMAAGLATMRELTPDVYKELDRQGRWLRKEVSRVFEAHDVAVQVTGVASLFHIHFTSIPVRDHRSSRTSDTRLMKELFLGLLNHGVFLTERGMGALSTPMGDSELQHFVDAVDQVLTKHPNVWQTA